MQSNQPVGKYPPIYHAYPPYYYNSSAPVQTDPNNTMGAWSMPLSHHKPMQVVVFNHANATSLNQRPIQAVAVNDGGAHCQPAIVYSQEMSRALADPVNQPSPNQATPTSQTLSANQSQASSSSTPAAKSKRKSAKSKAEDTEARGGRLPGSACWCPKQCRCKFCI